MNEAWQRLKNLSLQRQEKLFGAHEIQRFNRDADETIAWIAEKDAVLSAEEYGRDLASVQALQRKHEGRHYNPLVYPLIPPSSHSPTPS